MTRISDTNVPYPLARKSWPNIDLEAVHKEPAHSLSGSALGLFLYDVCEEIKLEKVRAILGTQAIAEGLRHAAAEQILFERPPVIERILVSAFPSGEQPQVRVKYYDYGVISVLFEFPFAGEWSDLIALSSRWMSGTDFETHAARIAGEQANRVLPALVKPYSNRLSEDYFAFYLRDIAGKATAAEVLSVYGREITQVVRGETAPLAENECHEVLQSAISYYTNDLVVVGWNAAFVYDPAGAETALQLLEYANTQLLEFRYYDDLLTRELGTVYDSLARRQFFRRWRLPREASRLQALVLDITELTERADNAIKFLSDMFSARLYRLASARIGVPDYKNLVREKLRTAGELYRFLVDEFHQARTFILESLVVVILMIELFYIFRGKM